MWTKQKNKTGHTKRRRQKKSCKACTRTSSSVATLSIFWAFLHIFTQMKKVNTNFAHVDILSHVRIFQNIHKYSHTINYQYFFDPVSIPEMKRTCTNYARRRLSWKLFAQWLASKLMLVGCCFFLFFATLVHIERPIERLWVECNWIGAYFTWCHWQRFVCIGRFARNWSNYYN